MSAVGDLLDSFQLYYSTRDKTLQYSAAQRAEIEKRYVWFKIGYARAVYDAAIALHPTSLRSLPDVAVISAATKELYMPEVYDEPDQSKQIEDHTELTFEEIERLRKEREEEEEEPNHHYREQIRAKREKGDATLSELWWLECVERFGGVYRPMPAEFIEEHAGRRRW
jgi:hypothetical protein